VIKYPKNFSEFEIQSTLFSQLKLNGFDVRGEVSTSNCRFDLVVFAEQKGFTEAICIVETKAWLKKKTPTHTVQIEKYSQFNIPIIVCGSYDKIFKALRRIEKIHNNFIRGKKQEFKLY